MLSGGVSSKRAAGRAKDVSVSSRGEPGRVDSGLVHPHIARRRSKEGSASLRDACIRSKDDRECLHASSASSREVVCVVGVDVF
jgi:hypothetical protein